MSDRCKEHPWQLPTPTCCNWRQPWGRDWVGRSTRRTDLNPPSCRTQRVNSPLCYRLDEAWRRWYSSASGQHHVQGLQGQTHIYCSDRNTDWDSKRPESFFKLYWNVIVDLKQKWENNNQQTGYENGKNRLKIYGKNPLFTPVIHNTKNPYMIVLVCLIFRPRYPSWNNPHSAASQEKPRPDAWSQIHIKSLF